VSEGDTRRSESDIPLTGCPGKCNTFHIPPLLWVLEILPSQPAGTLGRREGADSTHNRKKCKHLSASIRVWFESVKTARIKRLRGRAQKIVDGELH